jgi:hypothetical protein
MLAVAIAERKSSDVGSRADALSVDGGDSPSLGELLRIAYFGAWRADPSPLDLSLEETVAILPQLIDFGGVGLVWPRLSDRAEAFGAAGMALEYAMRQQRKRNAAAPAEIARAVTLLREAGVDPVLIKGWSVSRLYPRHVVRLSGDIDLVVRPDQYDRARAILARSRRDGLPLDVDLHHDGTWTDVPRPDFREFTETIDIDGTPVRVLRPELQLNVLCHHFMRHACLRPLWLCDIALVLESRPAGFDWELFLGEDRRRRGWVTTAIGLAHALLGAETDDIPIAAETKRIPAWLPPAVILRWEHGEIRSQSVLSEIGTRGPLTMLSRHRWPDPVGATIFLNAPFNGVPRLPLQWAAFLYRAATYGVPGAFGEASRRVRRLAARVRR